MTTDFFLFSQCIAALSFFFGILSFQFRLKKRVLLCWFVADALNAFHFLLLGRYEAMILLFVSAARFLVAAYSSNRRWMIFFALLMLISFYFTYEHPVSFLILISGSLGIYGTFHKVDASMRFALFGCGLLWITHNIIVGSPVAVVMECCYLGSNVLGIWRFYRHIPTIDGAGRVV